MAQNTGNAKNILVGASPLFLSNIDVTASGYEDNAEPGTGDYAFISGESFTKTLNDIDQVAGQFGYRNVGYTNNGLQVTYNPSYGSVTVDQLLDTAKLFKESMEVMIATEMAEGTLENVLAVFGQPSNGGSTISSANTLITNSGTGDVQKEHDVHSIHAQSLLLQMLELVQLQLADALLEQLQVHLLQYPIYRSVHLQYLNL